MPPTPGHFLEEYTKPPAAGLDSFILAKDIIYVGVAICTAISAYVP